MKRIVITATVEDDTDLVGLASDLERDLRDPTVWAWGGFWLDVQDGRVGPNGDGTTEERP